MRPGPSSCAPMAAGSDSDDAIAVDIGNDIVLDGSCDNEGYCSDDEGPDATTLATGTGVVEVSDQEVPSHKVPETFCVGLFT